jgi:hypothetical protein
MIHTPVAAPHDGAFSTPQKRKKSLFDGSEDENGLVETFDKSRCPMNGARGGRMQPDPHSKWLTACSLQRRREICRGAFNTLL